MPSCILLGMNSDIVILIFLDIVITDITLFKNTMSSDRAAFMYIYYIFMGFLIASPFLPMVPF